MPVEPEEIQGWMAPECLRWLTKRGAASKVMAEAGCWKGRSTAALMQRSSGVLYAIDTWAGTPDRPVQQQRYFPDASTAFEQFCENMKEHIDNAQLVPLRMTSLDGASYLRARLGVSSLDFCFIDADHSEQAATADIRAYYPLVKKGAVLAGHDYTHDGVNAAVTKTLKKAVKRGPGSIWFIIK